MDIKCTVLIDDKADSEGRLFNEHGLSLFIETGSSRILFDTGKSGAFIGNAEVLGVDLQKTDFVLISHGHYDHGGGLNDFLSMNRTAPVYIHPLAAEPVFFSSRGAGSGSRYIGIDPAVFSEHSNRMLFPESEITPQKGIHIMTCTSVPERGPIIRDPDLYILDNGTRRIENFDHEIFIVIEREKDIVVISGCSHNNIVSMIEYSLSRFPGKKLSGVIGGFHLPDMKDYSDAHAEAAAETAEALKKIALTHGKAGSEPAAPLFHTGHCTGNRAKSILLEKTGSFIDIFHTGSRIFL